MNNGVLFPTKGLGDAILLDRFFKIFSGFSSRFAKFIIYLEALVLSHTTIKVSHDFYYVFIDIFIPLIMYLFTKKGYKKYSISIWLP